MHKPTHPYFVHIAKDLEAGGLVSSIKVNGPVWLAITMGSTR